MAHMPDLSRRAVLGLGAGVVLGAAGGYGLDNLLRSHPTRAIPVSTASTQVRLAPPTTPLEPPPAADPAIMDAETIEVLPQDRNPPRHLS